MNLLECTLCDILGETVIIKLVVVIVVLNNSVTFRHVHVGRRPRGFEEQGNMAIYFQGTREQKHIRGRPFDF